MEGRLATSETRPLSRWSRRPCQFLTPPLCQSYLHFQIKRLRAIEGNYDRARPLEITIGVGPVNLDTIKELEDLGVERMMPGRELISRDSLAAMRNFHDRVLSKL